MSDQLQSCPSFGKGYSRQDILKRIKSPPASSPSPTDPTLTANPFPEVTDLFCRLPLPTLSYQLGPAHLGDSIIYEPKQRE